MSSEGPCYKLEGGRYDGLVLVVPDVKGRPRDAAFWLATWGHGTLVERAGPCNLGVVVTNPGSYTVHDDVADFRGRCPRFGEVVYVLCKDQRLRTPKFAEWVHARPE